MTSKSLILKVQEVDSDDSDEESEGPTFRKQFLAFSQGYNSENQGTHIVLSQSDNWMRQAGVLQGRQLTTTDTGVCYFKFKKHKLNYYEYLEFLQLLADYKRIPVDDIIEKMILCGPPHRDTLVANVQLQSK